MWKPLAANWRQRDLAAVWTSPVTQTRRGDVTPFLQELLELDSVGEAEGFAIPQITVTKESDVYAFSMVALEVGDSQFVIRPFNLIFLLEVFTKLPPYTF